MALFRAALLGIGVTSASLAHAASMRPVAAANGMVVTAQHLATKVGVSVLQQGGNAVDAAVAVGYALAVVYPAAGNLGGGGFMTLHLADGRQSFIDFREKAPIGAHAGMFLDQDGQVVPGLSTEGHRAVAVPGTVAGLELARERFGSWSRKRLISPAIRLAERGFTLDAGDIEMFESGNRALARDPASAAIFLPGGKPLVIGDTLRQRDLARTLRAISQHGVKGFYRGWVADALVASSQAGGGLLSNEDLTRYQAVEREPVRCSYRGYAVVAAAPPSSGGVTVCQILGILEGYPMGEIGSRSAQGMHYLIEAMRYAYFDRNNRLGDPDFITNPIQELLSPTYHAEIRSRISSSRAGVSSELGAGTPLREGNNTTHYSIADRHGNAVSVTYTINDWFGAKVTAKGTGVLLNNEMDDFTSAPGVPNAFGLVQGENNAIAPGKRPLSSMSPTILTRGGKPVLVLGTPGGSRIITAVVQTIINMVDEGMDVQEAVDAPRIHHQWLPDQTYVERFALSPDTRKILTAWGHRLVGPHPANHMAVIAIGAPVLSAQPDSGMRFFGANDPRRNTGLALGY